MQNEGRWIVNIEEAVLGHNAVCAAENRERFRELGLKVINIVSSPGAGKTALLERTLCELQDRLRIGVIVGDMQTDNDARRLSGKGAPVVQITTGGYCHLEASMVARAAEKLCLEALDLLIIENVGNLVCPASYDLGEDRRVVLHCVTEGEDKPLKYPVIFRNADVVLVTKTDIARVIGVDMEAIRANLRQVAPQAEILELSARSGEGMYDWYIWLQQIRNSSPVSVR